MTSPATESSLEFREVSIFRVALIVLHGRRFVMGSAAILAMLLGGYALSRPAQYRVEVAFRAEASAAGLGELGALAAQFGVSVPRVDGGEPPDYFRSLITSREILLPLFTQHESASVGDPVRPLLEYLDLPGETDEERRAYGMDWLQKDVMQVEVSKETGVVTVAISTPFPQLSRDLAGGVMRLVDEFNGSRRRSRARSEREFVQAQSDIARAELRAAEATLRRFLEVNRAIEGSPSLQFERDRLLRDVALKQGVTSSLAQALEQARIAEVRDTPVITVVQGPYLPGLPERKRILMFLVSGAFAGAALSSAVLLAWSALRGAPRAEEDTRVLLDELSSLPLLGALLRNRS